MTLKLTSTAQEKQTTRQPGRQVGRQADDRQTQTHKTMKTILGTVSKITDICSDNNSMNYKLFPFHIEHISH